MPERWIRSRLAAITADTTQRLDRLDLGGYAAAVTEFAWSDFCDWYLELAKIEMRDPDATPAARLRSWRTAVDVLADTLRLLHPVMPFVTEEIWSAIASARQRAGAAEAADAELLMTSPWPAAGPRDAAAEAEFTALAEVIRTTRTLRTEARIPAGAIVELRIAAASPTARDALESSARYLEPLARARTELLPADAPIPDGRGAATALGAVWLGDAPGAAPTGAAGADRESELRVQRDRVRALLADAAFLERAPAAVVDRERQRLADLEERLRQIGSGDGSG
jgi:valyl-tRNA synthetase